MSEESLEICLDGDSIVKIKLNTGLIKVLNLQTRVFFYLEAGCFFSPEQRDNYLPRNRVLIGKNYQAGSPYHERAIPANHWQAIEN